MKQMNKVWVFLFLSFVIHAEQSIYKVGLLVVATGKYIDWVQPLIASSDLYFLPDQKVTYYIFTDSEKHLCGDVEINTDRDVHILYHKRLGWPYDTMMRPQVYYEHKDILQGMDYLFATDADMRFVDIVGDEILGDLVATQHPGFVHQRGSYETNPLSTAYVASDEGHSYFAGGFNGGTTTAYLKLCATIAQNVHIDLSKNYIAIWHDESHINRYFIDNKPTVTLSPSYCYPESWQLPYAKRLLALDKNHAEVRK